jgi:hypothetical protein
MITDIYLAPLEWHDGGNENGDGDFAMFDYRGESYTFRRVSAGVDVYRLIEGEECRITRTDYVTDAREFVALYAKQLIDC